MKRRAVICILTSLSLWCRVLLAQPNASEALEYETPSHSVIGITVLGNPSLSISRISDYQEGVSINHNTLQLTVPIGVGWSLQVRALDDLRYQNQSIPISSIAIQSLNLGNRPEMRLSTVDQTLASGLNNSPLNVTNLIRYRAVGGNTFLRPAGIYTTTLIFTYTAL